MMRIFVYEYACAMPMGALPASLRTEGRAMLDALLADFELLPDVETVTLLNDSRPEETVFRELAHRADYTLIIAPESDDVLHRRSRWVEEEGGRLLGSTPQAIQRTGDKLALGRYLHSQGVPTPACHVDDPRQPLAASLFPAVWKPRYGAGSQATFLVGHPDELASCRAAAQAEGWSGESILQPFVPGLPASSAFLVGPRGRVPLLPTAQHLSTDGRFRYRGGTAPLPEALAERARRLGLRALTTVPGLCGYVGVDLVLGTAKDGSQDWVIEINPRLTTSYVGLRALARTNLAGALLHIAIGDVADIDWREGTIHFEADGTTVWR